MKKYSAIIGLSTVGALFAMESDRKHSALLEKVFRVATIRSINGFNGPEDCYLQALLRAKRRGDTAAIGNIYRKIEAEQNRLALDVMQRMGAN